MDILSYVLGYKKGISQGGSGDAVVWYVTFIGADGSVLFKMPVLDGDDCKDPKTHGDITTPTKESTVSEVFTHSGWALTSGGSADSSALNNITADKTVYAAFTASTRYYTITYYDADGVTVLKTESLAYGATPSYAPEKDGYVFAGFNPALTQVTGDMSYTAIFNVAPKFSTATWEEISSVSKSGTAESVFSLGETREETLTWADGSTEKITLQIAAIYKSSTQDGESVITLVPTRLLSKKSSWANSSSTQYATLYDNAQAVLKPFLENTVVPAFSEDLQSVLKTAYCGDLTFSKKYYQISPLSCQDLGWKGGYQSGTDASTCLYGFDTTAASRVRYLPDGTASSWWTLHCNSDIGDTSSNKFSVLSIGTSGQTVNVSNYTASGVLFKIFV